MAERFEIVVAGAGPAGSLTAMLLAGQGCQVALVDRVQSRDFSIGETLPPQVSRLLTDLGLMEHFAAQGHRPSPGIVSAWGSAEPSSTDYLFSCHGDGWHIDRSAFNQLLREAATAAGATYFRETRIKGCVPSNGGWILSSGENEYHCQILVDATGRHPSSRLPFPSRWIYDGLVSVGGLQAPNSEGGDVPSDYTLVESTRDGWFYSALLPNGKYIVTFTTDADLYAAHRGPGGNSLTERLRDAPLTRQRVGTFPAKTMTFSAVSMQRQRVATENWIAVGDASQSYDPISGQGVWNALQGALSVASVIPALRHRAVQEVTRYQLEQERRFDNYLEMLTKYYAQECRWQEFPFWARRHRKPTPRAVD